MSTKNNVLIGQSGGPTAVINSSLAGIIETAMSEPAMGSVFGRSYGIERFMNDEVINLGEKDPGLIRGRAPHQGRLSAPAATKCRKKISRLS